MKEIAILLILGISFCSCIILINYLIDRFIFDKL